MQDTGALPTQAEGTVASGKPWDQSTLPRRTILHILWAPRRAPTPLLGHPRQLSTKRPLEKSVPRIPGRHSLPRSPCTWGGKERRRGGEARREAGAQSPKPGEGRPCGPGGRRASPSATYSRVTKPSDTPGRAVGLPARQCTQEAQEPRSPLPQEESRL